MNPQEYSASGSAESEVCKQGEASTSTSSKNGFKLDVTNIDYNVKEELECPSDFSEVLDNTETPKHQ
jgi:hypothetical protein